jgi:hypothetical protein
MMICDQEYEIESFLLHQKQYHEGNSIDDFGSIRQTKSKSLPSHDTFDDDFVYTRKIKGKKSVPGWPPVREHM